VRLAIVASHPIQYYAPLYRELARRCELTVFFAHRATQSDQAEAGFGVGFEWDVDLLASYQHVFLRNVAKRPGLGRFSACDTPEIGARLRSAGSDAVLIQGWHLKSYLQALIAAKRLGLPVMLRGDSQLATRRSPLKSGVKAIAFPPLLRLYDAALYVGRRSREYWLRYRYPADRLFFSPHCVDTEWFASRATASARQELRARLGIEPGVLLVVFAGKLVPFKRPLDIVAAVARLKGANRKIEVLVAGAGELEAEMRQAAQDSGVALHLLGFRNQRDMPAVYAAGDVLALPSDGRETWGMVANEALACCRPVVLSEAVGSAPDLAEDATAGRVFPEGDVPALAGALLDLAASPPAASAIAAKSRSYGLAAAADGIEAALACVASRGRSYV